jgi:hypothetical protein
MLRDVVKMPAHYVSFAHASHRSKTGVVAAFEKLLIAHLGTTESAGAPESRVGKADAVGDSGGLTTNAS